MNQKKGLTRLHELEAAEISLVPQGANRRRFLIYKDKEGIMAHHQQLHDAIMKPDPHVMQKVEDCMKAYMEKMGAVHKDLPAGDEDEGAMGGAMDDQSQAAVKAVVRILTPFKDKVSPLLLHEILDAAGFQVTSEGGEEPGAMHIGDGAQEMEEKEGHFSAIPAAIESEEEHEWPVEHQDALVNKMKKSHMHDAASAGNEAYKAHMEKLGYRMYPDAEMAMKTKDGKPVMKKKGEHVAKSASDALDLSAVDSKTRQVLEQVFKGQRDLITKNAALESTMKAMKDAERKKELVEKAASFSHVGVPSEDLVAQLEVADKAGPEHLERVLKTFGALNEQARSSKLFGEYGSSVPATGFGGGDAHAKIEKMAEGIVQKSGNTLSKEEAYEKAILSPEGRRLYAEHQAGRKDGI